MMTALPPTDARHGLNGYNNLGCRCEICRAANREYQKRYRQRQTKVLLAADDPRHGTAHGYTNLGCRCDRCRVAHSARRRVTA